MIKRELPSKLDDYYAKYKTLKKILFYMNKYKNISINTGVVNDPQNLEGLFFPLRINSYSRPPR